MAIIAPRPGRREPGLQQKLQGILGAFSSVGQMLTAIEDRKIEQENNELISQSNKLKLKALQIQSGTTRYDRLLSDVVKAKKHNLAQGAGVLQLPEIKKEIQKVAPLLDMTPERLTLNLKSESAAFEDMRELQAKSIEGFANSVLIKAPKDPSAQTLIQLAAAIRKTTSLKQLKTTTKDNFEFVKKAIEFKSDFERGERAERRIDISKSRAATTNQQKNFKFLINKGFSKEDAATIAFRGREDINIDTLLEQAGAGDERDKSENLFQRLKNRFGIGETAD